MEHFLKHSISFFLRNGCLKIILVAATLLVSDAVFCQNTNSARVTEIRQQMAKIRQSTNWDNPAEAKAANEQIKVLMKQLTEATSASQGNPGSAGSQNQSGSEQSSEDADKMSELQMEMAKQKVDVYTQIWEAGSAGKSAPVLIAQNVREEIVREFKEDESPEVKSMDWLESMPYLIINASMPGVDLVIDQMTAYKGIKTLIITCDKRGTIVDLNKILSNAKDYPLEELHILNFGSSVSALPSVIGDFSSMKKLSLLNNNIKKLPQTVSKLTQLEILHADLNPIQTLLQEIGSLKGLKQLGIAKTSLPETEITKIQQALPNCEILR